MMWLDLAGFGLIWLALAGFSWIWLDLVWCRRNIRGLLKHWRGWLGLAVFGCVPLVWFSFPLFLRS